MKTINIGRVNHKSRHLCVAAVSMLLLIAPTTPLLAKGGNGWSSATTISPTNQPDPRGGSQMNDVAVNASGLTIAAWDQYNFYAPVSASIGIAIQSGGRWGSPCTFSGTAITADPTGVDLPCVSTTSGITGYSMTPKVAVGTDGTMAVSWTFQDAVLPGQKVHVAVKPTGATGWRGYTLASFTPGGVSITRSVPVAVDAIGNVTAAWNIWDGTRNVVQSATLAAGSNTWSETSTLSGGHDGLYFSLAVNANGDAGLVYTLSPYTTYSTGTAAYYVYRKNGIWSTENDPPAPPIPPVKVSETIMASVGYVVNPQVALDANGWATIIYFGNGLEATRQVGLNPVDPNSWTNPTTIISAVDNAGISNGASYISPDLAGDDNGNAIVATSIFDPTVGVDRASVWVTQGDARGNWTPAQRLTDPSIPEDAYATRVAVSPDGALKLVGWIDHYHGIAQVSQLSNGAWGPATTIGRGRAFASFQNVMGLDASSSTAGSSTVARAIWKNAVKGGIRIEAANYNR